MGIVEGTVRVIDGNNLDVAGHRVRLKGIDAPEKAQLCRGATGFIYLCGQLATRALHEKIGEGRVICAVEPQLDRHGGQLGTCYGPNGEDINGWLVSQGHALAYSRYDTEYIEEQGAARIAERGVWSGKFVEPWRWRNGERLDVFLTELPLDSRIPLPGVLNTR